MGIFGGSGASKKELRPSTSLQGCANTILLSGDIFGETVCAASDEDSGSDLAGVGITFRRVDDDSLMVKSILDGSSAWSSGVIKIGDCLMEVDGKSVYCKGIDVATKAILGRCGSVVQLRLARVEGGQRYSYKVALVRELRASKDPHFRISQQETRTTTQQVFLTCMHMVDGRIDETNNKHAPARFEGAPPGAGAFVSTDGGLGHLEEQDLELEGEGRNVFYQGKWYTEAQVRKMEIAARALKDTIAKLERELEHQLPSQYEPAGPGNANTDQTLSKDEHQGTQTQNKEDPGALLMKEKRRGMLSAVCSPSMSGRYKEVSVRVGTGGQLFIGEDEIGRVMGAKALSDQYAPDMNKGEFQNLHRRFVVMLEGEQIMAHSSEGAITAFKGVPVELIAATSLDMHKWVLGINTLLKTTRACLSASTQSLKGCSSLPSPPRCIAPRHSPSSKTLPGDATCATAIMNEGGMTMCPKVEARKRDTAVSTAEAVAVSLPLGPGQPNLEHVCAPHATPAAAHAIEASYGNCEVRGSRPEQVQCKEASEACDVSAKGKMSSQLEDATPKRQLSFKQVQLVTNQEQRQAVDESVSVVAGACRMRKLVSSDKDLASVMEARRKAQAAAEQHDDGFYF